MLLLMVVLFLNEGTKENATTPMRYGSQENFQGTAYGPSYWEPRASASSSSSVVEGAIQTNDIDYAQSHFVHLTSCIPFSDYVPRGMMRSSGSVVAFDT
jgi:hypothetical protein